MNVDEILTFLAVVDNHSISAAANCLYISQSSASSRINNLEKELGIPLIYRAKGVKTISLTVEGEHLLPIAQQWLALYHDVQQLKSSDYIRTLRIAANDLLNTQLLPYIYTDFSNKYKNIMLYIQTEHSTEAHNLVANQLVDIAFVYTQHDIPNIISEPLYHEKMMILCHKKSQFFSTQNLRDLRDDCEVTAKWSANFEAWHHQKFPYSNRSKIVVGTASMIGCFLNEEKDWCIVSKIVGDHICRNKPDFTLVEYESLPRRTAYMITHKFPKYGSKELINTFINELVNHLRNNPSIELLYKHNV